MLFWDDDDDDDLIRVRLFFPFAFFREEGERREERKNMG